MANGFSFLKKMADKKKKTVVVYEDFDSDDSEDFDLSPQWLRNRQVYKCELEKCIQMNSDIVKVDLDTVTSETAGESGYESGYFKCIILQNTSE